MTEVWQAILRNKLRTAATGFAVSSGLFLLIVLLGAGNGIIHTLNQNSESLTLNQVEVYPGETSIPYDGLQEGRSIRLDNRDLQLATDKFEENVLTASAVVNQGGLTLTVGKQTVPNVELRGCAPECQQINNVTMLHGRFINTLDLREKRKVIVLMERNAKMLYPEASQALGQWVKSGHISYQIVGIFKDSQSEYDTFAYAPYSTIQQIFNKGLHIDQLQLTTDKLRSKADNENFNTQLRRAMSVLHRFAPDDKRAIWIWNSAEASEQMSTAENLINMSFWILGLLTLLSGIAGVSNIMLISVKERTHEFGIRRAIGAKPASLIFMVIMESVLITALFGYIGMVAGIGFTAYMDASVGSQSIEFAGMEMKYFIDPTVGMDTCVQATFVMIIAGAVAGAIPARKAAKVKPIEALREA